MLDRAFNSKQINIILLITFFFLFASLECKIVIPFKYIPDKSDSIQTPKEIMNYYLKEKINLILEIGTPKQEAQIPIGF